MAAQERTTTAVRFPTDLHETLQQAAAERDWSMNTLVVRATRDYINRLVPIDEVRFVTSD